MDTTISSSRSSPALTARHSRRSFPNLTHLSLAPLSSRFPLDDEEPDDSTPASGTASPSRRNSGLSVNIPRSYSSIPGKSAPTTPSILSRPSTLKHSKSHKSRARKNQPTYIHDAATLSSASGHIHTKSKSTTVLHPPGHLGPPGITANTSSSLHSPSLARTYKAAATATTADEWLHRAGVAISTQSLETRGQSWLVSRASSTSLTNDANDAPPIAVHLNQGVSADDGQGPATPRLGYGSRYGSRAGSRTNSARNSRRNSRVGSKADFTMTSFTPAGKGSRTPARRSLEMSDYFGDDAVAGSGAETPLEPDFVDGDESIGDVDDYIAAQLADDEVRTLAAERGFGFGGLVDRVFGMALFDVDEDDQEELDEDELRQELEKEKRQRIADKQMVMSAPKPKVVQPPKQEGEEGGWKDAAWLFSVASKVIL